MVRTKYSVFVSFEDNAAWEQRTALACQTAQSRNLVLIWLEIPVKIEILQIQILPSIVHPILYDQFASENENYHVTAVLHSQDAEQIKSEETLGTQAFENILR